MLENPGKIWLKQPGPGPGLGSASRGRGRGRDFENEFAGAGAGEKMRIPAVPGAGAGIPVEHCYLVYPRTLEMCFWNTSHSFVMNLTFVDYIRGSRLYV